MLSCPAMTTFALLALGLGCSGDDDGFGGAGNSVPPPNDTGPFFFPDDTGDTPTDTQDTQDTDTGDDSGVDSGETGDTGLDIEGTGYGSGDVAYNLKAPNQSDAIWALYRQYGSVILLTFGDGADPQFQEISGWSQALADKYGLAHAAFLLTDASSTQADVDDAATWASTYGIGNVLYKPLDGSVSTASWASLPPMVYLIDQEMVIDWTNQGNAEEGQVEDKIKDLAL